MATAVKLLTTAYSTRCLSLCVCGLGGHSLTSLEEKRGIVTRAETSVMLFRLTLLRKPRTDSMNQQSFKTVAYPMVKSSTYAIENKHNNRYHYTNPRSTP